MGHVSSNPAPVNTHTTTPEFPVDPVEARTRPEKLSDLLLELAAEPGERISIRQLAEALEDRSFGAFMLIFSLPNLIPLPPGATLVLGLPMIFVAWQILIGYDKVWLPRRIADFSIERSRFRVMAMRVAPWLKRAENWVRPRRWPIHRVIHERLFGLLALVLAVICAIPIPFGNWPPAVAFAVLGVAHTERDGYCLGVGIFLGLLAILMASAVVFATGALLMWFF